MKIKRISISNLRNHKETILKFNNNLNLIYGLNGAGKTTILEAISICGFSKSFLPTKDSSLIRINEGFYRIKAEAMTDLNAPYKIEVKYEPGKRKSISSTVGDNLSPKDIIGEAPTAILSPDFKSITFGSPGSRRSFINRLLSQIFKSYIESLYKARKALRQRNTLLSDIRAGAWANKDLANSWTEVLIEASVDIISKRAKFVEDFNPVFKKYYEEVSGGKEDVDLEYDPSGGKFPLNYDFGRENVRENLERLSYELKDEEIRRGMTLFGPQKDDLKILINGGIAKEYASQGQHKTLLISLKMAEFEYLKEMNRETPIVLFDDIFSELDADRVEKVLEVVRENKAQTFITATDRDLLMKTANLTGDYGFYKIKDGEVVSN